MATLNNLSSVSTELTPAQLDTVDGGLIPVIIGLALLDVYIWGKVVEKYSN
ncbi:MAG TPA: hypothetical protein VNZ58_00130 [Thermomicrobiales bacterium]|nr:hypothetical protein [Thermomicrobiales bacterium]